MQGFSANLGFLWTELPLPEAIKKASDAGFDAVECHWPYDFPTTEIVQTLEQSSMTMLGMNTIRGNADKGDFGLSAVPGREAEAKQHIDQAVEYAEKTNTGSIHVMAGKSDNPAASHKVFLSNIEYAAAKASANNINILIEPINHRDVPGYFLNTIEQAKTIIDELGRNNVKIMFDCYHTQITQGDLLPRIGDHLDSIGHIQIAAAPSRAEPDNGEINYPWLCRAIADLGYTGFIGAEYKPASTTEAGLAWLAECKNALV